MTITATYLNGLLDEPLDWSPSLKDLGGLYAPVPRSTDPRPLGERIVAADPALEYHVARWPIGGGMMLLVRRKNATDLAMTTQLDGRPSDWPESWHPATAQEVAEALIAELRNALVPARYWLTKEGSAHLPAIERVLEMATVCAEKLQGIGEQTKETP